MRVYGSKRRRPFNKSGAGAFSPLDLPNLVGWWDASDAGSFTYSSGTVVSQWNDLSGNARHLTQATVAKQPTRNATINGLSAVTFDGTSDMMETGFITVAQPFTMFSVVKAANTTTNRYLMGSSAGNIGILVHDGSAPANWAIVSGVATLGTVDVSTAAAHMFAAVFNGASSKLRVDSAEETGNPGSTGIANQKFQIGATIDLAHWSGVMGEIALCSSAIAGADLTAMETYMSAKWGTP